VLIYFPFLSFPYKTLEASLHHKWVTSFGTNILVSFPSLPAFVSIIGYSHSYILNNSRRCLGKLLGLVLSQILLGFYRWYPSQPRRVTVSIHTLPKPASYNNKNTIRPSPNVSIFITLIVRVPVIQIFTMIIALFMIALEFPLPQIKHLAIHRSIPFRIVMLLFQASIAILFYQVIILFFPIIIP